MSSKRTCHVAGIRMMYNPWQIRKSRETPVGGGEKHVPLCKRAHVPRETRGIFSAGADGIRTACLRRYCHLLEPVSELWNGGERQLRHRRNLRRRRGGEFVRIPP